MNKISRSETTEKLYYPNRKLGFARARTLYEDEYNTQAMANVALANLRPGETITLNGAMVTVKTITEKAITVTMPDGKSKRITPESGHWNQLVRDMDGYILCSAHSRGWNADPDIVKALKRDPAFGYDERGIMRLRDNTADTSLIKML